MNLVFVDLAARAVHHWLPLRPRGINPDGSTQLAAVAIGDAFLCVGAYNNPPIGDPDVLTGAWLPIEVTIKAPKIGKSPRQLLIVPYDSLYGHRKPKQRRMFVLLKGVIGALAATSSSEVVEYVRNNGEVLLTINAGCSLQATTINGTVQATFNADCSVLFQDVPTIATTVALAGSTPTPPLPAAPVQPAPDEVSDIFEIWKRLSISEGWLVDGSQDKDWLQLLCTTLKAMYPRWSKRVAHVYPEPPWQSVCLPLTAATHQSPTYGSQWAIDSQYFAGFYDATGVNADLAAGSMPANRLLMRCIYEMYWLSKVPAGAILSVNDVRLTVPSMLL